MNLLDQFGVSPDALKDQVANVKVVPNRVAHIDADFLAYIVAADTVAEKDSGNLRSIQHKCGQMHEFAETVSKAAGASSYVLHITPQGSNKGGRYDQAVQQAYQGSRSDREVPEHLPLIRKYIELKMQSVASYNMEADDAMSMAMYADPVNNIVCSRDKDLRMVPGWHLDMDTNEHVFVEPDTFGYIELDDSKSTKKVVGYGPAFFFAQCLMGDAADTVRGLPAIPGPILARKSPTAAFTKQLHKVLGYQQRGEKVPDIETERLNAAMGKTKPCGAVGAFNLLEGITSVKDAFAMVKECFQKLGDFHQYDFSHWRTGEPVTPTQALLGDMRLLWMRRTDNPDDVVVWLKENAK